MTARPTYSRLQIALHWLIALLIITTWFLGDGMGRVWRQRIENGQTGFDGNTLHIWLGMAVFALVLLRLLVRRVQGSPAPLPGTPRPMELAAHWGHRLLYLLILLVPASGMSGWYLGLRAAGDIHETSAQALMLLALAHAAAALFHQFILRDGTLRRMVGRAG